MHCIVCSVGIFANESKCKTIVKRCDRPLLFHFVECRPWSLPPCQNGIPKGRDLFLLITFVCKFPTFFFLFLFFSSFFFCTRKMVEQIDWHKSALRRCHRHELNTHTNQWKNQSKKKEHLNRMETNRTEMKWNDEMATLIYDRWTSTKSVDADSKNFMDSKNVQI